MPKNKCIRWNSWPVLNSVGQDRRAITQTNVLHLHVDKRLYLYVHSFLYFNQISINYNITQFEKANCIYNKKLDGPLE